MKDAFKLENGILNWLQESAEIGIFTTDNNLIIQTWNKWLDTHSLFKESEVIGRNLFEVCQDLLSYELDSYYQHALGGHSITLLNLFHNYIVNDLDNKHRQHSIQISPLRINDQVIGTITVIAKLVDEALEKERQTEIIAREDWERIFDSLPDLITIIDVSHRIIRVNRAMADCLKIKQEDAVGRHCYEIVHSTGAPPVFCPHSKLMKDAKAHSQDLYVDSFGGDFNISTIPFFDRYGKILGSLHIAHDISERIKTEEILKNLSLIDDLTELYNRRGFITFTEQLIKTADRLRCKMCLLFIDLNDMKYINDTFGHLAGDKALKDTAYILRDTFRESDVIGRYGGDEFIVSALQVGDVEPATIKERLNNNIDLFNKHSERKYKISLSIGIAIYDPEAQIHLDDLIFDADHMMYEDKYRLRRQKIK